MIDAAGYARYSTDLQNETSIVAQLNGINAFCQSNNLRLAEMYIDEAKSGTNMMRNGFERMIQDAHKKKFKAIVVYDISRGSRDVVDWLSFRKEMRALGIVVHSATERLGDISQPGDFLTELITIGIGQHQVLQSRQKSIDGKRVRASRGLFCGGVPPIGYDVANGQYIINEREAEVVRLAFDMYARGYSYSEIAYEIDKTGVRGRRGNGFVTTRFTISYAISVILEPIPGSMKKNGICTNGWVRKTTTPS